MKKLSRDHRGREFRVILNAHHTLNNFETEVVRLMLVLVSFSFSKRTPHDNLFLYFFIANDAHRYLLLFSSPPSYARGVSERRTATNRYSYYVGRSAA